MTRYDIVTPRARKDGKTFWLKIRSGFSRENGGYSIVLDALPIPDKDGKVTMLMSEPREKRQESAPAGNTFDDEIPF